MPSSKHDNGWTDVFQLCLGRQTAARNPHRHLINVEDEMGHMIKGEDNGCFCGQLSPVRLDDSAYFSGDESSVDNGTSVESINTGSSEQLHTDDQMIFDISHDTGHLEDITGNVYRRTSIQDRCLRITRQRHLKVAMRKKAALLEKTVASICACEDQDYGVICACEDQGDGASCVCKDQGDGAICVCEDQGDGAICACEDQGNGVITAPHLSDANIVSRTSSVQLRSWEIRRRRKDLLHQRRSKGYHGVANCDVIP